MARLFLIGLLSATTLWQCAPDSNSGDDNAPLVVRLECETQVDSIGGPVSDVYLLAKERKVKVAEIGACELFDQSTYAAYQIPDSALAACGSADSYVYVIRAADALKVFQGQNPPYKEIFRIELK
ncbi:MAG: hypothetical protein IPL49_19680 [Saprospirales bacterium]|nr:hypothetical protein [Saprospirales bacterium]MBK8493039.1 hypothetical protein [Saprospirales bacterium]